jgi:hypothetical protein
VVKHLSIVVEKTLAKAGRKNLNSVEERYHDRGRGVKAKG